MEHAFFDNEKVEKQPKAYQRKKEDHGFFLSIFKRSWLRAKENIMFALPRTLIPGRWPRQFYI